LGLRGDNTEPESVNASALDPKPGGSRVVFAPAGAPYILVYMFVAEVCSALKNADVAYALVGGYAVALHGAVRGTVDVDIVLRLKQRDYERTEKALGGLGLRSKLPVSAQDVFQFRREYIKNRNLVAWSFADPSDPTRLVDVIITFDKKRLNAITVKIGKTSVRVLNKRDLIEMKRLSGRPQDLEDIRALESIP
jgi:hypothetical protein